MGFCYLNNIAIAARQAQDVYGLQRVAIVDWDVHHGTLRGIVHWVETPPCCFGSSKVAATPQPLIRVVGCVPSWFPRSTRHAVAAANAAGCCLLWQATARSTCLRKTTPCSSSRSIKTATTQSSQGKLAQPTCSFEVLGQGGVSSNYCARHSCFRCFVLPYYQRTHPLLPLCPTAASTTAKITAATAASRCRVRNPTQLLPRPLPPQGSDRGGARARRVLHHQRAFASRVRLGCIQGDV